MSKSCGAMKIFILLLVSMVAPMRGARLLEHDLFIAHNDPSAFNPTLNFVLDAPQKESSRLNPAGKAINVGKDAAMPCEEKRLSADSLNHNTTQNTVIVGLEEKESGSAVLTVVHNDSIAKNESIDGEGRVGSKFESVSRKAVSSRKVVFNQFPKGPVTPSGPSHKGYAMINQQRLSRSKHSPAVGHMQVQYSPTINGVLKSRQSPGVGRMQKRKRVLKSVPSPGVGH
eukprot:Gb_22637 [translate_table: standard]